ncbi:MAG: hypothetical protein IJV80_02700 [Clostridia bacterium]|nr:hypothetical protein [Clostridia bacterium]
MENEKDLVVFEDDNSEIELGKWSYLHQSTNESEKSLTVLAVGERCLTIAMKVLERCKPVGLDFNVVNARFVKPLDKELLNATKSTHIVTLEDNVLAGGFGQAVTAYLASVNSKITVKNFAYRDEFIPQGSVAELQREYGVSCDKIFEYIQQQLQ